MLCDTIIIATETSGFKVGKVHAADAMCVCRKRAAAAVPLSFATSSGPMRLTRTAYAFGTCRFISRTVRKMVVVCACASPSATRSELIDTTILSQAALPFGSGAL